MSFKEQYTTADLVSKDIPILDPKTGELDKSYIPEASKTVLSNDFFMLGQQLECLINKMVK